jgi:ribose 1,5-bisphosphate isomerase
MEEREVVTCFLRNEGAVLLFRRSEEVGSYSGQWGAVAGHAEGDPEGAAREEISEETGLDPGTDVTLVRRGEPFPVTDETRGIRWTVHPFLFDCTTREITPNWETAAFQWVAPTAILHRETVPDLWTSYDQVRPTPETVAADREHGAAYVSVCALEVLRDEAALATEYGDHRPLTDTARALLDARPSMAVLENRVNRVMHAARGADSARAVEHAASAAIEHAVAADRRAAERAADRIEGQRVATVSRSGTVLDALRTGDPEAVLVAESRPGGEGVGVAETLADDSDVTLTTDAGFAHALATWDADVLLVGADTVLADGRVVNKAGTRCAAIASSLEGIEVVVVAAVDKISPDCEVELEARDGAELYDGDADMSVLNRTFDVTPPDCVDAVVTDCGILDAAAVERAVADHRARAKW